jgi:hypothetical protein
VWLSRELLLRDPVPVGMAAIHSRRSRSRDIVRVTSALADVNIIAITTLCPGLSVDANAGLRELRLESVDGRVELVGQFVAERGVILADLRHRSAPAVRIESEDFLEIGFIDC